jgi:hypothetical protein
MYVYTAMSEVHYLWRVFSLRQSLFFFVLLVLISQLKMRPIFESWSHYRKMAIFILSGKLVSLTSDDVTVTGERVSG